MNEFRKYRLKEYSHRINKSKEEYDLEQRSKKINLLFFPFKIITSSQNNNLSYSNKKENEDLKHLQQNYLDLNFANDITITDDYYFTPSLLSLCIMNLVENFDEKIYNKSDSRIKEMIEKKLDSNLSLQLSVPLVTNELFWKKSAKMRWSDGQIEHFKSKMSDGITWKKFYLQKNLEVFLESMQSYRSMQSELMIIESIKIDNLKIINSSILDEFEKEFKKYKTLKEVEKMKKRILSSTANRRNELMNLEKREKEIISINNSNINKKQLHSHKMKPTLNYYLCHCKYDFKNKNIKEFSKKLNQLYDGNETSFESRLNKIKDDNDILSFYENAIIKPAYNSFKQKKFIFTHPVHDYSEMHKHGKLIDGHDGHGGNGGHPKGNKIRELFDFFVNENLSRLKMLCDLSKDYITHLKIDHLSCHFDLSILFDHLPKLEYLDLTYSVKNTGISFDLNMYGMKKKDAVLLEMSLKKNKTLKSLKLNDNFINDDLLSILVNGLMENKTLEVLDLTNNVISESGAIYLSIMLKREENNIQSLNLSGNRINTQGLKFISRALSKNKKIKELNLSRNCIDDKGGIILIQSGLSKNHSLVSVDLSNNCLTDQTLRELANSTMLFNVNSNYDFNYEESKDEKNDTKLEVFNLESINLSANSFVSDEIKEILEQRLKKNNKIKIDLRYSYKKNDEGKKENKGTKKENVLKGK